MGTNHCDKIEKNIIGAIKVKKPLRKAYFMGFLNGLEFTQ